jgi:Tfp pilus assembly protein PilF
MMQPEESFTLAIRCHQRGDLRQAEPLYQQVIQGDPTHAAAHHYLGLLAQQTGRLPMAEALMRRAAGLNPAQADFHSSLGLVLKNLGRRGEAIDCLRQALWLEPCQPDVLNNLGLLLREQGDIGAAIESFQQALRINPSHSVASYNLGNILMERGQAAEAAECFRRTVGSDPSALGAWNNLGSLLLELGRRGEAAECFAAALRLNPEHAPTRYNRSLLRLLEGDLPGAWADYEYRWRKPGFSHAHGSRPLWDGAPLAGRTILLHAEQGLGDTIQLIRYAPLVRERGGRVVLECQPALLPLLSGIAGVDQLVAAGAALPDYDVQAPLLSLPAIFGTTLATIPASIPYLRADPVLVASWRRDLAALPGFMVGIAWQGNPNYPGDRRRSFPAAHFEGLARVPGVRLISLQKGPGTEQLGRLANRLGDLAGSKQPPILDLGDRLDATAAFLDTAAVMKCLDLVIAPNSVLVHLAGALGVPVWLPLAAAADWRWLLERSDSPWYPTVRLFRQSQEGDWDEVFERITRAAATLGDAPTSAQAAS